MTSRLVRRRHTVQDVKVLKGAGPWPTKSGGELNVLFQLPLCEILNSYFRYAQSELDGLSHDIRGLRTYVVSGIPKGTIGANEWHRNRNELVFALNGTFTWNCEDALGDKKTMALTNGTGVWTPPFILHNYEAQTDNSSLLVIANTLYIPDNPETHDSYSAQSFQEFQASSIAT